MCYVSKTYVIARHLMPQLGRQIGSTKMTAECGVAVQRCRLLRLARPPGAFDERNCYDRALRLESARAVRTRQLSFPYSNRIARARLCDSEHKGLHLHRRPSIRSIDTPSSVERRFLSAKRQGALRSHGLRERENQAGKKCEPSTWLPTRCRIIGMLRERR